MGVTKFARQTVIVPGAGKAAIDAFALGLRIREMNRGLRPLAGRSVKAIRAFPGPQLSTGAAISASANPETQVPRDFSPQMVPGKSGEHHS